MTDTFLLNLTCRDRPGIVATVSGALFDLGANILENHQFTDPASETFCMRTRFELASPPEELRAELLSNTAIFEPSLHIRSESVWPRMLAMVSKHDHCLVDLLYRWRAKELPVVIPLVVSNHEDLRPLVEQFGIAFEHIPVTKETKPAAEAALLRLVEQHEIDFVVLARYMQVLSDDLCSALNGRAINIHHSFLPGFKGAKPYHQAKARGVKLIGATAHYVTAELDEGPIICQGVEPVTHAQTADDLVIVGKDIERVVLSKAVKAHAEGRVFRIEDRTVVF